MDFINFKTDLRKALVQYSQLPNNAENLSIIMDHIESISVKEVKKQLKLMLPKQDEVKDLSSNLLQLTQINGPDPDRDRNTLLIIEATMNITIGRFEGTIKNLK